ncbi:MAG: cellulase family glycosylhydrolase [Lachnospiraceae bacterium]|nr:cellulase family glycosylhydrolase [Lachnospiraceae bacterium]
MKKNKLLATGCVIVLALSLAASGCKGNPVPSSEEVVVLSEITPGTEDESVSAEIDYSDAVKVEPAGAEKDSGKSEKTTELPKVIVEEASEPKSEKKTEAKKESAKTGKTPFEIHGALKVSGNKIVDANGKNFQICGVSTHGLGWFPQYVNKDAMTSLRDDFGANTIRLAMYTAEGAGYCTGGDRAKLKNLVTSGVDFATDAGMYAIIDWHILHDLDPNVYKADAKDFFNEMSKKYGGNDNVIYEICNEPNGGTTWAQVKAYAEEIIPVIRANDKDAIIIVGTPTWSQDVDEAVKNPITGDANIVYAVHFYADTHKDNIRNKVKAAEDAGYPVLISEFSICDASGNGNNNIAEADTWIKLLDSYGIGFVAWNLSNKNESSSLIAPYCQKTSGWSYDDLSQSGKWLVGVFDSHSDQGSRLAKGQPPIAPAGTNGGQTVDAGGNQGNQNPAPVNVTASGSSANLKVTLSSANSWNEGSDTCVQYGVYVENTSGAAVNGWSFTIDFGMPVTVNNIWGGKASVSGNTVTVTPESYNGSVDAGKILSDVGMIVKSQGAPGSVKVSVP